MSAVLSRTDVLMRLQTIAEKELQRAPPLLLTADLAEEVAPDSLARLTLVTAIENEFRICIDDEKAALLQTVDDVVTLIVETAERQERKSDHA